MFDKDSANHSTIVLKDNARMNAILSCPLTPVLLLGNHIKKVFYGTKPPGQACYSDPILLPCDKPLAGSFVHLLKLIQLLLHHTVQMSQMGPCEIYSRRDDRRMSRRFFWYEVHQKNNNAVYSMV